MICAVGLLNAHDQEILASEEFAFREEGMMQEVRICRNLFVNQVIEKSTIDRGSEHHDSQRETL